MKWNPTYTVELFVLEGSDKVSVTVLFLNKRLMHDFGGYISIIKAIFLWMQE